MIPGMIRALETSPEITALLDDPARDLLAVTDRYPPNAVGGAEVSLHLILSQPAFAGRVVVALFDREARTPTLYRQNGVPVLMLPDAAPWPLHRRAAAEYDAVRAGRPASRLGFEAREGLRFLALGGRAGDLADRATALGFEIGRKPRGGVIADFGLGPGWARARAAAALVARMRPAAALLDNTRSILLADALRALPERPKIVAIVRDNRFHCTRHDQSVNIEGVPCETCRFQCAPHDAGAGWRAVAHRRHLEKTHARRRAALDAADLVVVTSRYLERALQPLVGRERLRRVPNPGDNVEAVAEAIRGVAERPGLHLAIVGMLNEAKGQLRFLREAADWLRADLARHVHLAGRGDRMEALIRAFVAEAGIGPQVTLHGFLPRREVLRLMRECQIVAAPTVWPEPFGRTPLEAALARRPTVAFAQGGLAESILDGETGYLVPPGDYAAFLARLEALERDEPLRRRMGAAAALHVGRTFSVARSTALLEEALAGGGRERGVVAVPEAAPDPLLRA